MGIELLSIILQAYKLEEFLFLRSLVRTYLEVRSQISSQKLCKHETGGCKNGKRRKHF